MAYPFNTYRNHETPIQFFFHFLFAFLLACLNVWLVDGVVVAVLFNAATNVTSSQ